MQGFNFGAAAGARGVAMRSLLFALLVGGIAVLPGCGGGGAPSGGGGQNQPTLVSINITPANPTIGLGATQQFTVTGTYSDGTTRTLSGSGNWQSSNTSVATINTSGLATAVSSGTTTISVSSGTISGSTVLTVANALKSIAVTPATVAPTGTQQLTATGTFADGTTQDLTATATWQSSNSAIATINAGGLASGVSPGMVTITATSGTVSGTASLTVTNPLITIAVMPAHSVAAMGTKPQFTAIGTYYDKSSNDVTAAVTWSSSNPTVATINNSPGLQGLATALNAGQTTITATPPAVAPPIPPGTPSVQPATSALTVTNASITSILVTPQAAPLSLGVQQQYDAVATFNDGSQQDVTNVVTWTSSDKTKVTITVSGLATGVGVTTHPVTITATAQNGVSGSTTVTVDVANLQTFTIKAVSGTTNASPPALAQGTAGHLTATGTLNNGSTLDITSQVQWTSNNTAVATVSRSGFVRAAASVSQPHNTVVVTATIGSLAPQTITLDVTDAIPIAVTVTPITGTIQAGTDQNYAATGSFNDGSSQDVTLVSTWVSSDTTKAIVTAPGKFLGVAATAPAGIPITATFGGQSGSANLVVTAATLSSIAISPSSTTLAPGSSVSFQAIGTYSDSSTANLSGLVKWASSNNSVVTINSPGVAVGQAAGQANISASYEGKSSDTVTQNVVVTSSPLTSISVTPTSTTVPIGVATKFNAIGSFQGGSTENLTTSVSWASSSPSVGTVSNAFAHQGTATGIGPGSTAITAVFAGKTGTATLNVSSATITQIVVTPSAPTVTVGSSVAFTAKGTFSDSTVIDLTSQVVWSSSVPRVATINNEGIANTASAGTTDITATFNGKSSTPVVLTVN